uniref:Uncharacterized protein n=1 Tax=Glossina austeni TaxID=7395 RepID=A0A1A9V9L4_GLOAU
MRRCKEPKYAALGPPLNFDKPAPPDESRPLASENRLYPAPKERELPKCFDRNEVDCGWHSDFLSVHIRSATSLPNGELVPEKATPPDEILLRTKFFLMSNKHLRLRTMQLHNL